MELIDDLKSLGFRHDTYMGQQDLHEHLEWLDKIGMKTHVLALLKKLNDLGAVDEYTLKLNKNKVKIKRFSWEIMKQFMVPVTYGIVVNFLISFAFGFDAIVFVLGGTVVFMSQLLYTLWKILKTEEIIEVYLKC